MVMNAAPVTATASAINKAGSKSQSSWRAKVAFSSAPSTITLASNPQTNALTIIMRASVSCMRIQNGTRVCGGRGTRLDKSASVPMPPRLPSRPNDSTSGLPAASE